jgi:hypothetical protein
MFGLFVVKFNHSHKAKNEKKSQNVHTQRKSTRAKKVIDKPFDIFVFLCHLSPQQVLEDLYEATQGAVCWENIDGLK